MIRQGTVQLLESNVAHVQLDLLAGCGRCSQSGSCGVQLLPQKQQAISLECELPQSHTVALGDRVTVEVAHPDKAWLIIVSLAYGLPIIGMLLGAGGGYLLHGLLSHAFVSTSAALDSLWFPSRDLLSAMGFLFGLAGGLFAWDRRKHSINPGLAKIGGKLQ